MSEYTVESVLASLGISNPMDAARQQARLMLLGRLSRYEAVIQQIEHKQGRSFEALRQNYQAQGIENREDDDDFLEWQWYQDAIVAVKEQLAALSMPIAG